MSCLIMCRGLTAAQSASRVLTGSGMRARIVRPPAGLSPEGCAYAIEVEPSAARFAGALLRERGQAVGRTFCGSAGGYREMRL